MPLPPSAMTTIKVVLRSGPLTPDQLVTAMRAKGWPTVDVGDVLALIAAQPAGGVRIDGGAFTTAPKPPRTPAAPESTKSPGLSTARKAAGGVNEQPQRRCAQERPTPRPLRELSDHASKKELLARIRQVLDPVSLTGLMCPQCLARIQGGAHRCRPVR